MEWNKNKERNSIIKSLRKDGKSITEISKILKCSKSTASFHSRKTGVKNLPLPRNNDKATKAAAKVWSDKRITEINKAKEEWKTIKNDPKFMAFIALYWGEGSKGREIRITNMDPAIIIYCKNILELMGVKKFSCRVRCYPQHESQVKDFWNNLLNIECKIETVTPKSKKLKSIYGICYLSASNFEIMHRIFTLIDCWKKEIMVGSP